MDDFDLSAYLGVFLDEVDEQLQILDTEILCLEKDSSNMTTIQNIFRAAHTLKGSSASMGFEKMKEFTHHLENIFEKIRQKKLIVNSELINIIFNSIDLIRQLKISIVDGTLDEVDITSYVSKLEKMSNQGTEITANSDKDNLELSYTLDDFQKNVICNGVDLGYIGYELKIILEQTSQMKNVRALLIENSLKEAGEVIATFPAVEIIENDEHFNGEMIFILLTMQTQQEVLGSLSHISDIAHISSEALTVNQLCEIEHNEKVSNDDEETTSKPVNDSLPIVQEKQVQSQAKITATVRVDVDKLEYLMNLVGELVIDQTRLVDVRGKFTQKESNYEDEVEILNEVTNHLGRVISELQEGMMKTRMLPIDQLFNRFPRMVRDTAIKANKEIDFIIEGKETELDRTLIEEISDPIIHLLRNAIDHGIESPNERLNLGKPKTGQVLLRASHEENHVVISITDDGKGIDPDKIKKASIKKGLITEDDAKKMSDKDAMFLIFQSGISTAEKITDISGRGVGMDIVKSHIENLKGIIDIESTIGQGTTFTIKLPLTLAIIRSLLVKFGDKTFAIPLINVLEIIRIDCDDIHKVKNQEVGMVRGRVLPLVRMKDRLGIQDKIDNHITKKREFVVVVGIADKRIGIIADKTIGNQEIVIKSLGSYIGSPPFISGATIMGDGSVALILDVSSIVREQGTKVLEQTESVIQKTMDEEKQLVTFKLNEVEYGIDIYRAKDIISVPTITKVIEGPKDLLGIINLRGNMLPVIDLKNRFKLTKGDLSKKSRIIVVENENQDVGFLVDEVVQVMKVNQSLIEQPQADVYYNSSHLIKGVGKLDNRIVLLLEFDEILASINMNEIIEKTTRV